MQLVLEPRLYRNPGCRSAAAKIGRHCVVGLSQRLARRRVFEEVGHRVQIDAFEKIAAEVADVAGLDNKAADGALDCEVNLMRVAGPQIGVERVAVGFRIALSRHKRAGR